MLKKILMLTTGGTIASEETEKGLSPELGAEEILSFVPAVREVCRVNTLSVCKLDSTDVTPAHWRRITAAVEANYAAYDGFVICHGTDTLAYTAAALSYMIQNSRKPIVVTGAQKPIGMEVTDAKTNLLDSFCYAADEASQNVCVVFGGKVIAGTRARKERTKSYHAFSSLNFPFLAVIQDGMVVRYLHEPPIEGEARFFHQMRDSVFPLKMIPGLTPDILPVLFARYDCIVLESFGVGGVPRQLVDGFYREMSRWAARGKFAVMTTQVAGEGSHMAVYEVGRQIKRDLRMLEAYDMTFEAVIAKLMWLMGSEHGDFADFQQRFYTQINHDMLFSRRAEAEWDGVGSDFPDF